MCHQGPKIAGLRTDGLLLLPLVEPLPNLYYNLVQALREDRTLAAAGHHISSTLGPNMLEFPALNLETVLEDSHATTPLLCILSSGENTNHACDP